mgnify:CR=1 FL=1
MGFMDGFTSDGTVELKHGEYYNLMKEAAKAELITNAIKADVPGYYIGAMITGKLEMPVYDAELAVKVQTVETTEEWGSIASAAKGIFNEWHTEHQVAEMAHHISEMVLEICNARIAEIKAGQQDAPEKKEESEG